MHKIMNLKEAIAGREHAYYKQKLRDEFWSKYRENYEQQRDAEIAEKTERTENHIQQQARDNKIVGENILNVADAVHAVYEGVGIVMSVIELFQK